MKFFMLIIFFLIVGYYTFKFIRLLVKMKQAPVMPMTREELHAIRKFAQTHVKSPAYSQHKTGIIIYTLLLVYLYVMIIIGLNFRGFDWHLYLLLLLPLIHTSNLLNLFVVVKDGLLTGTRFVAWKHIRSFQFVPIDCNHRYYGNGEEVNNGYELRIQTAFLPISLIVTTDSMKEKLTDILEEKMERKENRDLKQTMQ